MWTTRSLHVDQRPNNLHTTASARLRSWNLPINRGPKMHWLPWFKHWFDKKLYVPINIQKAPKNACYAYFEARWHVVGNLNPDKFPTPCLSPLIGKTSNANFDTLINLPMPVCSLFAMIDNSWRAKDSEQEERETNFGRKSNTFASWQQFLEKVMFATSRSRICGGFVSAAGGVRRPRNGGSHQ